ncbi:MAG: cytochrome b/b6 domain-containing protein, partial [Alphaproteobacteria bacterium]|nr:cytochrome b/b6 domain-containing protein [Alphaproteobacteria bacterium]
AFAFMAGIVLMVVLWLRQNIPSKDDLVWLARGGGLFMKGSHPPARKFNAGQKIFFWIVILGGLSISLSGLALLFPFKLPFFAVTFETANIFGFDLPTNLNALEEVQLSQLWHAVVGLVLIIVIIAHIYIGTIGMVGAFDAMGTGNVDENWAREHHSLWAEEALGDGQPQAGED